MSGLDYPEICSACSGVIGASTLIDQLCKSLVNMDQNSDEFKNRRQQAYDTFSKIKNYEDQLRAILG